MLSDEEKKAIEKIKKILYMFPESEELKLLSNLIEKQSKKIEELKRVDKSNSQIIANMSTRHFNDREKIRKYEKLVDKIKAKIEEVDYKMIAHQDVREAVKQVLQSLLEKE